MRLASKHYVLTSTGVFIPQPFQFKTQLCDKVTLPSTGKSLVMTFVSKIGVGWDAYSFYLQERTPLFWKTQADFLLFSENVHLKCSDGELQEEASNM